MIGGGQIDQIWSIFRLNCFRNRWTGKDIIYIDFLKLEICRRVWCEFHVPRLVKIKVLVWSYWLNLRNLFLPLIAGFEVFWYLLLSSAQVRDRNEGPGNQILLVKRSSWGAVCWSYHLDQASVSLHQFFHSMSETQNTKIDWYILRSENLDIETESKETEL